MALELGGVETNQASVVFPTCTGILDDLTRMDSNGPGGSYAAATALGEPELPFLFYQELGDELPGLV